MTKPRRAKHKKINYALILSATVIMIAGAFFTLYLVTPWSAAIEEFQVTMQEMFKFVNIGSEQYEFLTGWQEEPEQKETIEKIYRVSSPEFRQKPFLMGGHVFVPVQELAAFLEIPFGWDTEQNELVIHYNQSDLFFEIFSDRPGFGMFLRQEEEEKKRVGMKVAAAEAAELTNDVWPYYEEEGAVFLPVRPLADYLDWNISWDTDSSLISLSAETESGEYLTILFNAEVPYSRDFWPPPEKVAYLTFDDGPSKKVTPLILDILKENNIKATFFVVGKQVNLYPEMLKRAYEEGHAIGNHSFSHQSRVLYSGISSFIDEVDQCEEIIYNLTGEKTKIFRMPYTTTISQWPAYRQELQERGYNHVTWNVNSGDASGQNVPTERIISEVKRQVAGKKEVIILCHDLNWENTAKALPEIISFLKEEGYFFRKLDWLP